MRYVQNAIMVAALTVLTAGAVYAGVVTLTGAEASATAGSSVQRCPATGCTAAQCHATGGATHASAADASSGYRSGTSEQ